MENIAHITRSVGNTAIIRILKACVRITVTIVEGKLRREANLSREDKRDQSIPINPMKLPQDRQGRQDPKRIADLRWKKHQNEIITDLEVAEQNRHLLVFLVDHLDPR